MADAGTRSGVTWWAQLVLWATVLTVGALYLTSVERHRDDAARRATAVQAAPGASAPQQGAVPEPVPPAAKSAETLPGHGVSPPDAVGSRIQPETTGLVPVTVEAAVPAVGPAPGPGASPAAESAPGPATPPRPGGPAPGPAASAEVSPAEARAFAEAVTDGHSAGQGQAAPAQAPTAGQVPGPAGARNPIDAERARILAEYEALRRAVEADRGGWGRREQPGPYSGQGVARPGGTPGALPYQAPGGVPGYAPNYPRW